MQQQSVIEWRIKNEEKAKRNWNCKGDDFTDFGILRKNFFCGTRMLHGDAEMNYGRDEMEFFDKEGMEWKVKQCCKNFVKRIFKF